MSFHTSTSLRRWLGGALLAAAPLIGWAQADPPARVATLSALEGAAQIAFDGGSYAPAALNWPITTGTRLVTEPNARIELHAGNTALRLTGSADLSVTELDDDTVQVALNSGSLSLRVRQLQAGERVEIDTPQLALVAQQPGEYRIDIDPRADTTRVTVHSGSALLYGEAGQSSALGARQQASFAGRALALVGRGGVGTRDGFDQWVASRDTLEAQSISARYVSRDMPGYQLLDSYGEWAQDATYGPVWYPQVTVADWAPYRHGRWSWVEPWGWTWVDDAPWGFAPSHYGRWAQIGPRWAWVPGPMGPRPAYAPALVAFMGGGSGANWGLSIGGAAPAAAWFPLAPGEMWEPYYHASDRYRRRVNPWWRDRDRDRVRPPTAGGYHFGRRPDAISLASPDQFGGHPGRRPHFSDGSRLPQEVLGGQRVIPPPPRRDVPGMPGQAQGPRPGLPDARPWPRPDGQWARDPRDPRGPRDPRPPRSPLAYGDRDRLPVAPLPAPGTLPPPMARSPQAVPVAPAAPIAREPARTPMVREPGRVPPAPFEESGLSDTTRRPDAGRIAPPLTAPAFDPGAALRAQQAQQAHQAQMQREQALRLQQEQQQAQWQRMRELPPIQRQPVPAVPASTLPAAPPQALPMPRMQPLPVPRQIERPAIPEMQRDREQRARPMRESGVGGANRGFGQPRMPME